MANCSISLIKKRHLVHQKAAHSLCYRKRHCSLLSCASHWGALNPSDVWSTVLCSVFDCSAESGTVSVFTWPLWSVFICMVKHGILVFITVQYNGPLWTVFNCSAESGTVVCSLGRSQQYLIAYLIKGYWPLWCVFNYALKYTVVCRSEV